MRNDPGTPSTAATELMGHPAVERARAAHHLVRTIGYRPERFARMRDEAVHAALSDGVALQRIAQALEVLPAEADRMSRDHVLRTPSAGRTARKTPRAQPGVVGESPSG